MVNEPGGDLHYSVMIFSVPALGCLSKVRRVYDTDNMALFSLQNMSGYMTPVGSEMVALTEMRRVSPSC